MGTTSELLTSEQVCEALDIDRSTLSRWATSGRIEPAMKLPGIRGAYLFAPAEVERVRGIEAAS